MAASDAKPVPLKDTAYRVYFDIRKSDGTLITTWAGQDSEVSLDGASFTDCTNEATEIGTSGVGYIDLTASEMNADSVILKTTVTNTGALPLVLFMYPAENADIPVNTTAFSGDTVAADNAEAFFDGTGYAGTNNVIPNVTTVGGVTGLTPSTIADQVWDEPSADHNTAGTMGNKLNAAGAASDPLLNDVPGSYAAGSAGYQLGRIGSAEVGVTQAVASTGRVTIYQGKDYADADGTALTWTSTTTINLTGASVTFDVYGEQFAAAVTGSSGSWTIRVDLTAAQTAALPAGDSPYELVAVLASGRTPPPLAVGTVTVKAEV